MKKNLCFRLTLSEEQLRKLLYISAAEKRSPNNQLLMLLQNNLKYFEKTKGRITPEQIKDIDISSYLE